MVELKATKALDSVHTAQCTNYLKATVLHFCSLLIFGKPHLEIPGSHSRQNLALAAEAIDRPALCDDDRGGA
jgi:hypothetical protein